MSTTIYEKVQGAEKPKVKGEYDTNFGSLYFDGDSFIMKGHKRRTPTIVEWWLREVKQP